MYEIFHDKKTLLFQDFQEKDIETSLYTEDIDTKRVDIIRQEIDKWLCSKEVCCSTIMGYSSTEIASGLKKHFRLQHAAGGIVMIDDAVVTIIRHGIPDLPKGHVERGESPEEAAMREVTEETGLHNLEILKPLPSVWHCFDDYGFWCLKKTSWFLMKSNANFCPRPQQEEGIREVVLTRKNELPMFLQDTFLSISKILGPELYSILTK